MYDQLTKFHHACQNVVDNREQKALNWAVNYARYGLTITNLEEAKVQAAYILNNITHWRGSIAKETRSIFKQMVK